MDVVKPIWRFRPPPENAGVLEMCRLGPRNCLFGNACPKAHFPEEMHEWHLRISFQIHQKMRSVAERKLQSPIDSVRNLINESRRLGLPPKNMLTEVSGGQSILCKQNLFVTHLDKNKEICWEFAVKTNKNHNSPIQGLQNVFFLEKDCPEFSISSITNGVNDEPLDICGSEISLAQYAPAPVMFAKICVKFRSPSYGHFNVTIVFDFGSAPRIFRYVGVVVAPEKHLFEKLSSSPTSTSDEKHNELSWMKKYKLVSFEGNAGDEEVNKEEYSLPANLQYGVEFGAFEYMDVNLTPENYRDRLHNLLFVEEYERRKRITRLNVHCDDVLTLLGKGSKLASLRTVDVKKALFIPVSEDTLEEVGILITRGSKAMMRLRQFVYGVDSEDYVVHEALVTNILSGKIVLEISSKTLTLLKAMSSPVPVDICFRFVNTFLCMHSAIDRVNLDLVFYKPLLRVVTEDNREISPELHPLLSGTQSTALSRIIYSSPGPPVLLLGPFGTGKTQTVAEAIKILISKQRPKCRILICTHSNSAADHYIEDYLHPFFGDQIEKNSLCEKPLRLYWEHRLATSISDTLLPYCIMDMNTGTFRNPSLEELEKKTIIVTTLVTADMLVKCGVKPGFFTHIFIDEAAQAMEVETLIPLSLATEETIVVLAGDHLQLSPPVFSSIGRKLLLDKSLLARLYQAYPANSSRKILLLENFRSYPEIVNIPSKLFYEGSLVSKKLLPNGLQYPVKFYGVHGFEEKAKDSPSYVNMPEVAEITERVEEMVNTWPKQHFGELKLEKTCVLSTHYAQIRQIRRELRVNGFSSVRVENVNNVQGLEFDVLFLSTVRTSRLLGPGQHERKDLGFLSNPKLLNTAITRAKFCLIVVGDPVALCSAGDCRVCWKTILSMCSENGTFHYRVPLTQVLSSVREEHTQTALAPGFNSSFPYPVQYNAPPIPTELPLFPPQMRTIRQAVPVTPMTSPLHPQNYMYPVHTGLSTPPPYQSQLCVPGGPYSHVVGNHAIGNVRNPYSERVPFQPTSPRKPLLPPTVPTYYSSHNPEAPYSQHVGQAENRMMFHPTFSEMIPSQIRRPAPSYSYNTETRNNDVAKIVRASKEVKSSLSENTSSSIPRYQSQTPATTSNSKPLSKENASVGNLSLNELDENTRSLSYPDRDLDIKESHSDHIPAGNEESPQLSLPRNHSTSPELPILSLCQTLRHNIATSMRNITESEEAVNIFMHNALEDVAVEFKENIVAQTLLIQQQKSSLEQQRVLNRTLAKSIHLLEEESKQKNDVALIGDISSSSPRFTHVYKINLDGDEEVQEWYRLRRQDPIVQDYIKSFEKLSERARTRGIHDNQASESCDIFDSGNTDLAISLRGWVLQPQSVVYPDGNSLYEEHLGEDEASERIENGELIPCTLSVDRSSSGKSAICVVDDPLQKNILIPDRQSMNRAFNTDYVAVEISHDLEHQYEREGKVMAILQERHHRQVVCRLASPESTVMIPLNNTNPKFSILQSDNHVGQTGVAVFNTHGDQIHFQHFVSDVQDKLFLVQFLKWDVSYRYPLGFVAECFDQYSDIDSLIPILSFDHGITINDFPLAVIEEIETRFPETWRVPDEELQSRFRYEDAFTIDCKGAEELDDAISVRFVKYGIYSVSVHIADVSYFVNKGSLLDKTARERATSVYLAPPSNLALTLFPKPLSQLCSLLPGKERLAVSVDFLIDSSGSILKSPVFRKSVVVSQEQLSFEEVDGFLSGEEMTPSTSPMLLPLQVLRYLSRQLWARRVRAGSFQACTEASLQSDSRRIVEELMIITNKAVAEKLADFPDSHVVPFRIQQLPKYSALQSLAFWAAENTVNLDGTWLTQFLTGYQEEEPSFESAVCIDLETWRDVCQRVMIGNMADITEAILSLHEASPITARLQRNLPKSKYVTSNQYSSTERGHFALNADCYTHFTSPIRRYFDIVVHRVLFSETTEPHYDVHEMEELCSRLNLRCGNTAAFTKQCNLVCEAASLQGTDGWKTMEIDSVESDCITLKIVDNRNTSSVHKVKVNDIGATVCHYDMKKNIACWAFHNVDLRGEQSERNLLPDRLQISPTTPKKTSASTTVPPEDLRDQHRLAPTVQQRTRTSEETKITVEIPGKLWRELLEAIKTEEINSMINSLETINKHVVTLNNKPERNDEFSRCDDTCNVVKRSFGCGEQLQALLACSFTTGVPQPVLQAVQLIPNRIPFCIQHRRQPVQCFCEEAKTPTRERYSSVEEYERINIPLLMLESAERSVRAGLPSIHIKNVTIKWSKDTLGVIHGQFYMHFSPGELLTQPVNIHKHDFVCVTTEQAVFHGCIEDFLILTELDHCVRLVLNSTSTVDPPQAANVEVIPQCIYSRRVTTAVRNLPHAPENIRSMFLTRDFPVKKSQSRKLHSSSFSLDPSQKRALDKAMHSSFTIIEGQPGTGKTYTASAIAEQFYLENFNEKSLSNVLLCSPTEQALNDAENILSRVPTVHILRVYDREIEAESFPELAAVYGLHSSPPTTGRTLQESALHFKIRSISNPFHRKILKYAHQLQNMQQEQKEDKRQLCRVLEEYRKIIDMAEEYELTESGVNIVLCTCIEAGSLRIQNHVKFRQCIMDESHSCLEAESLVVFQTLGKHCERIILLGDSRMEAAPVIGNKLARRFGLNRSIFHSLRNGRGNKRLPSLILDTQHRMLGL